MRTFWIVAIAAGVAFLIDYEFYNGHYWHLVSTMLRQIGRSFGWR
ncbi:hypothetical protein [Bradyrhizobium sp. JYMT SZCCT0180]|nr:hypothetical protein [Bradyrhizobium sp. JYMT SZCCT0180]